MFVGETFLSWKECFVDPPITWGLDFPLPLPWRNVAMTEKKTDPLWFSLSFRKFLIGIILNHNTINDDGKKHTSLWFGLIFETWRTLLPSANSIQVLCCQFLWMSENTQKYTLFKFYLQGLSHPISYFLLPSSLHRLTGMHPWHQGNWSSLFFPPLAPHLCYPTSASIFPQLNFHFTSTIVRYLFPTKPWVEKLLCLPNMTKGSSMSLGRIFHAHSH